MGDIKLFWLGIGALCIAGVVTPGLAQKQPVARDTDRPNLGASMLDPGAKSYGNTPLFKKINASIQEARSGKTTDFFGLLAPKAKVELSYNNGMRQHIALTPEILESIAKNCQGPFPIGERSSWIQFSFICNPSTKTSLAAFIYFVNTPELTMTAELKNGRMLWLDAYEVPMIPGRQYVAMDAYRGTTSRQ